MSEQRERFEAWAVKPPREWNVRISGPKESWPGCYWSYPVQCAWESWQAACPEGWLMVPKDATEDMRDAAVMALDGIISGRECAKAYRAQLATAPKPEDV